VRRPQGGRHFVVLLQNVTETKNLQFQLAQKEKLAAVGQLAAGIAHEIRNPLASISGSIQLLQANLVTQSPEDTKLFRIVIREIDRLNNLISEFLDFVRPDVRLDDPIEINTLAREVLEMAKMNPVLNKKVQQKTELRANQIINGHYDKLKQALLNITINAYQAMNDTLHPEIWVRSYDDDDRVVLEIQDNGCGITRDNLKRVFEPFHTTKPGGTGLGLAITHKIIESHDADINVESEWGHGAKFTIVFRSRTTPDDNEEKLKKQA
jgi:two-component system sensor histidine kinase PilS (NtrC family)